MKMPYLQDLALCFNVVPFIGLPSNLGLKIIITRIAVQ